MFKFIKKRDGRVVPFNISRITNAIYKASVAAGMANRKMADKLAKEVVKRLVKKLSVKAVPTVEQIQDFVEQILIDAGYSKIAKTYILYRQHRAEIRHEKQQILNKTEIDDVDKHFDVNALRVLAARYLRKNDRGEIIESPKELFERVAVHGSLPSLFYDPKIYRKNGGAAIISNGKSLNGKSLKTTEIKFDQPENIYSIGKYKLNRFHLEAVNRLFNRFYRVNKLKIHSFSEFLDILKSGYFNKYEKEISDYYNLMISRQFMPNTPALANFGNYLGMGSACFTLDIDDSLNSIMDTLKAASIIFQAGGGVGYNFSKLRPEGDFVKTTAGTASGPVSFMRLFDCMTDVIKQGGIRRGANMGILNINHPDIEKFVIAKRGNLALRNFNISVLIMSDFWDYYEKGEPYPLLNPRTGQLALKVDSHQLFDSIVYQAWESAEPGVIFYDRINEYNPFLKSLGPIMSTNPCGEVLLYPNESCNLGSINVWSFVKESRNGGKKKIDWPAIEKTVKIAVRFLDNIIDVNKYPLPEIEEMTFKTRKIGLGVMGVSDTLYDLKLPYNSKLATNLMEKLMEFINYHSKLASIELAKERGPLPLFKESFYKEGKLPFSGFHNKKLWHFEWDKIAQEIKKYGVRNGYTTVIAPTGSISMIAGCSSGMEPVYSLVFEKKVVVGSFYYFDPVFEEVMQREGLMDEALISDIVGQKGSIKDLKYIPKKIKDVFVTALDIAPDDHIRALAAFQKWTDSAVSKTNNFPRKATVEDVKKSYLLAHELGCKNVTVFRDTSIKQQVLTTAKKKKPVVTQKDEKAKGMAVYRAASTGPGAYPATKEGGTNRTIETEVCPNCGLPLVSKEGCRSCPNCGWGVCTSS
jgi:ribonucleoside-diphosphate reductase alpha chain